MHGILHFDGGSAPKNPGHAAFACVVDCEDGTREILSRYIGIASNNVAEYYGLIVGIKLAHQVGVRELEIISDSKLVVEQILGNWMVKQEALKVLCKEARNLLTELFPGDLGKIYWQERIHNEIADDLCTRAICYGRNLNPFVPESVKLKRPGEVFDRFNELDVPLTRVRTYHNS